jgi:uncharacterized protein YjbI with pentapeptide repeats
MRPYSARRREAAAGVPDPARTADQLLVAANEASSSSRNVYLVFLGACLFMALVTAGLTDEKLLLDSAVALPFIEKVELPFSAFYAVVPWLLVFLHGDLLLNLSLLASKLRHFNDRVAYIGRVDSEQAERTRVRLSNFPLAHWISGNPEYRFVSATIGWATVIALPLAMLIYVQVGFLPYHSVTITWIQRAAVLADAVLIVAFWPSLVAAADDRGLFAWWALAARSRLSWRGWRNRDGRGAVRIATWSAIAVVISLGLATIPDEGIERALQPLFSERFRARYVRFDRNIELVDAALDARGRLAPEVVSMLRSSDEDKRRLALDLVEPLDLRGRDLRFARLAYSVLPKVDLRGADLTSATLRGSLLPAAVADANTSLRMAILSRAQLHRAQLAEAQLDGAVLSRAQLQGSTLRAAHLQEASLYGAELQGANLEGAHLEGARLDGAQLEGARLQRANLRGATLDDARLHLGSFDEADFRAASLKRVQLDGGVVQDAEFEGAAFTDLQASASFGSVRAFGDSQGSVGRDLFTNVLKPLEQLSPYAPWLSAVRERLQSWPDALGCLPGFVLQEARDGDQECLPAAAGLRETFSRLVNDLACETPPFGDESAASYAISLRVVEDISSFLATHREDGSRNVTASNKRGHEKDTSLLDRLTLAGRSLNGASCHGRGGLSAAQKASIAQWVRMTERASQ